MPDRDAHRARPDRPVQEGAGGRIEEPGRNLGAVRAAAASRGHRRYLEDGRRRGGRALPRAARRAASPRSGSGRDEVASPRGHTHEGSGGPPRGSRPRREKKGPPAPPPGEAEEEQATATGG